MYERWKNTEKDSDKQRKIKMMETDRERLKNDDEKQRKAEKGEWVFYIDIEVIKYLHTTY